MHVGKTHQHPLWPLSESDVSAQHRTIELRAPVNGGRQRERNIVFIYLDEEKMNANGMDKNPAA